MRFCIFIVTEFAALQGQMTMVLSKSTLAAFILSATVKLLLDLVCPISNYMTIAAKPNLVVVKRRT